MARKNPKRLVLALALSVTFIGLIVREWEESSLLPLSLGDLEPTESRAPSELQSDGADLATGRARAGTGTPVSALPGAHFEFLDVRGMPVEGIEVVLRAVDTGISLPGTSGVRVSSMIHASDDRGVASFAEAKAGSYSWSVPEPGLMLSESEGVFQLENGESFAVTILVGSETYIRGRLELLAAPSRKPHVRLHLRPARGGELAEYPPGGVYANQAGEFVIPCEEGVGYVSAFYPDATYALVVGGQQVEVVRGENDIGHIRILPTVSTIALGFDLAGERLGRSDVFYDGDMRGVLQLACMRGPTYAEMAWVDLGEELVVMGLWEGEWAVSILSGARFPELREGLRLPDQEVRARLEVQDESNEVQLLFAVEKEPVEVSMRAMSAAEGYAGSLYIWSHQPNSRPRVTSVRGPKEVLVSLPPGDYQYILVPKDMGSSTNAVCCSGEFQVPEDTAISMELGAGVLVQGRAAPGETVFVGVKGLLGVCALSCNATSTGHWQIEGVPNGITLQLGGSEWPTGDSPGTILVLE